MKNRKRVLTVLGVFIFIFVVGCCKPGNYWCKIEQEVSVDEYLKCTYYVKTNLWVYDCIGMPVAIEKNYFRHGIHKTKVDSVKIADYDRIHPRYLKLKKVLESGLDPCS